MIRLLDHLFTGKFDASPISKRFQKPLYKQFWICTGYTLSKTLKVQSINPKCGNIFGRDLPKYVTHVLFTGKFDASLFRNVDFKNRYGPKHESKNPLDSYNFGMVYNTNWIIRDYTDKCFFFQTHSQQFWIYTQTFLANK